MKRIRLGIKGRVTVFFVVLGFLLSLCIAYAVYTTSRRQVTAQYTELAFGVARTAAAFVHGDAIEGFLRYGEDGEYRHIYEALEGLKDAFGLMYLYVVAPSPDGGRLVYVFDIFTESHDPSLFYTLGEPYSETASHAVIMQVYRYAEERFVITDNEYGWTACAYVPIFTHDGRVAAVVGADISMDIVMSNIMQRTIQTLILTQAIVALSLYILLFVTGRRVLRPIVRLSRHMESVGSGNLQEINMVNTGDELQAMSDSFNRMVREIKLYMENLAAVTADRERIATELTVATQIQAGMLPCIFPPFPERDEFELYASMIPAKEVGGDFYDFFMVDER
ncbi:MAG: HAMP domain-containing protein, partial [Defluviitaleaceae bacterium]|nr:HAMP domain-containing protein [Defluviitaleaceae bacterium]